MKNFYADCMHLTNRGVLCEFSLKKSIVLTIWLYLQVEQRTFREIDKNRDNINSCFNFR